MVLGEFASVDPHLFSFLCDAYDLSELLLIEVALGAVFVGEEYANKFILWGLSFEDSGWIAIRNIETKWRTKIAMFLAG